MSIHEGTIWQRMTSDRGRTAISHFFVMDWASLWLDIGGGLLIAGALAAWVPKEFWQAFFLQGHPILAKLWGPAVGPIVAILSFVCSVGNVPLAAVLWNGGISFGGVIAFLFADLIVLPILDIYRKYYGLKNSAFLLVIFYISMALAALACGIHLRSVSPDSAAATSADGRRVDPLELHHHSQHRLSRARHCAGDSLPPHWRT